MKAIDIELALERTHFPPRLWILSPRVSWGMGLEECDLLALSGSGFAQSVEIKISMGDLRREFKKRKYLFQALRQKHEYLPANSEDRWFRGRWFAIPYLMQDRALPLIPDNFGVFSIHENGTVDRVRPCTVNRKALKWPIERQLALARNCMIKYWSLLSEGNTRETEVHPVTSERGVFEFVGIQYMEPEARK